MINVKVTTHVEVRIFFYKDQCLQTEKKSLLIVLRYAEVGGITFNRLIKPALLIPQDPS